MEEDWIDKVIKLKDKPEEVEDIEKPEETEEVEDIEKPEETENELIFNMKEIEPIKKDYLNIEFPNFKENIDEIIVKKWEDYFNKHLNKDYLSEAFKTLRDKKKEEESKEEEIKDEKEEEVDTFKKKQKYLHGQMRNLLKDYPLRIEFQGTHTLLEIVESFIQVYDLIIYCKMKTNDEEVEKLFNEEMDSIKKMVNINLLRKNYYEYKKSSLSVLKEKAYINLKELILHNSEEFVNKILYFSLAVPSKEKKYMHLRTAHGLPASYAEGYESEAISEGEKVTMNQAFKVNEEGGIELA